MNAWRLLDADAQRADWREVARIVLHIDPQDQSDRARRAFDSHLSRQMDDGARLAAPATWWRVGLNQTWKMVAGSTCAISAVLGQEEPLPHLSGYQVHHRRGIISAASSCVGAMRRGHCACKFEGHHEAALGACAKAQGGDQK